MAYSIQRDVSNGSLQYLEVRIDYFAKEHLSVYIAEKIVPQGTTPDPTSGYCWNWDGNRIKFNKAVANGLEVMVRRATPIAAPFHIFRQGAVFKDLTVDENFLQQLYINQENQEGQTTTDFYSDLNFHGYRLRNVGAAIHDYDAVPFSQYKADALGAMQQRILAEQARNTAVSAKDASVTAKTAAEAARDAALVSQNAAKTSETNAKNSENTVVPLVPVVDQAARDAAAASAAAAAAAAAANQAVVDVKNLGAVPIGSVLAFIKEPLPAGYLALRGGKFDKLTYPDLYTLLGTDILPDFTDRIPKMVGTDLDLLEKQGWCWPQHSHTFSGTTDTQGAHNHSRGDMNIYGRIAGGTYSPAWIQTAVNDTAGAFSLSGDTKPAVSANAGGGASRSIEFNASNNWSGRTSMEGAHTHNVSGTTSQAGNSDRVDVDRIGVIYAIKAAGVLSNEGLAQVTGIKAALVSLYKNFIGVPIPWGNAPLPAGYAKMNGGAFDKVANPLLAAMYPSGVLPDLRGEFLRGLDDGRGVDAGRVNGSAQGDAIRNITGSFITPIMTGNAGDQQDGTLFYNISRPAEGVTIAQSGGTGKHWTGFDASRKVPTAAENRPRNVAVLYICMTDAAIPV